MKLATLALLVSLAAPARAESLGSSTVRSYFDALGRNDFARALSLTEGAAQQRTASIVNTIAKQAQAHNARVELKLRRLRLVEEPAAAPRAPVPVAATFSIDVVGHKWFFSKVAHRLAGTAQFYVTPTAQPRIVAIEGNLH
jgi:hypothetical protein